ncbi:MAG: ROK family protein [Coriobacteriales bacterium]|jgi:glucokinase
MDSKSSYLGIDMGGTMVKLGLFDRDGNCLTSSSFPTPSLTEKDSCDSFARKIVEFLEESGAPTGKDEGAISDNSPTALPPVAAIGLAIPGVVNDKAPELLPNVDLDLGQTMESISRLLPNSKVFSINDANAAALGEMWQGAARDVESLLFLTIGTGVGGALVYRGHVISGFNGAAGEIGHLLVEPGGRQCGCGKRGCLEQYASATGIVRSFFEADGEISGTVATPKSTEDQLMSDARNAQKDPQQTADGSKLDLPENLSENGIVPKHRSDALSVFNAYEQGDPRAIVAVDRFTESLGLAISQVTSIFDPQRVLLGGGVSMSADVYMQKLVDAYHRHCIPPTSATPISTAMLGNRAGMTGAAYFAMQSIGEAQDSSGSQPTF